MKNTIVLVTLLLFLTACAGPPESVQNPNVLVIVTDDQGYADLSAYAHSAGDISTPNMDRIARDGVLFTQAYVTAPVCSPSRAGWNTGRYQERWDPKAGWNPGLPDNVTTIAEYFKRAGYATGKVGKNDYGDGYHRQDVREYPLNHGYDEFLGFSSHAHDYFLLSSDIEQRTPDPHGNSAALGALFDNRGKRSFESGYTTQIFTDWAIDFLKRHDSEPFFLHVAYNSVHHLIHEVPRRYLDRFGAPPIPNYDPATMGNYRDYYTKYALLGAISDGDMRKYYLANLACLDDNIGRLLDALDKAGLAENTLVVFFGDNGGSPYTGANNRPLRGGKYGTFEGGIRVPFMMRWPGELPAGQIYPHAVSTLDVLPTALEAAGIPPPPTARLDGESILEPVKTGVPPATKNRPFFWEFHDRWAARQGRWKLVKNPDATPRQSSSQILSSGDSAEDQPALFDIESDPAEQHNVARENPEAFERLTHLFAQWHGEMRTALLSKNNLFAWCIVPFDAAQRGPEERAQMLERLGITRFAYDWRDKDIPTFDAEIDALNRHGIKLEAFWLPTSLEPATDKTVAIVLDLLKRRGLKTQLWLYPAMDELGDHPTHAQRLDATTRMVRYIATEAAKIGCQVGLYNHGGWFGQPENEIQIIERAGMKNVGIVYNFHHGHEHLARFPELYAKMLPHLIALNLNGMKQGGPQILPLGQGDQELEMLRVVLDRSYRGPIGILDHRNDLDAEESLQENLAGLEKLRQALISQ